MPLRGHTVGNPHGATQRAFLRKQAKKYETEGEKGTLLVEVIKCSRLGYEASEMVSFNDSGIDISGYLNYKWDEAVAKHSNGYDPYQIDPYCCFMVAMADPFTPDFQPNNIFSNSMAKVHCRKTSVKAYIDLLVLYCNVWWGSKFV